MVLFNYSTKELTAKVVYYGPGLCGKTTNLQYIHANLPGNVKGKMLSLATKTDRTLFFDFLPLDLGTIRGMKTRIQLYTVPGQVFYNETRKLVLKGADGIVFVADSQEPMIGANVESFRNLEENLKAHGMKLAEMPHVIQFNKRDLPKIAGIEEMNSAINKYNAPFYESVATTGIGVQDSLKAITKLVLLHLTNKYDPKTAASSVAASRPITNPPSSPGVGKPTGPPSSPGVFRPPPDGAVPLTAAGPAVQTPQPPQAPAVPMSNLDPQVEAADLRATPPPPPNFHGPAEAEPVPEFGETEIDDFMGEVEDVPQAPVAAATPVAMNDVPYEEPPAVVPPSVVVPVEPVPVEASPIEDELVIEPFPIPEIAEPSKPLISTRPAASQEPATSPTPDPASPAEDDAPEIPISYEPSDAGAVPVAAAGSGPDSPFEVDSKFDPEWATDTPQVTPVTMGPSGGGSGAVQVGDSASPDAPFELELPDAPTPVAAPPAVERPGTQAGPTPPGPAATDDAPIELTEIADGRTLFEDPTLDVARLAAGGAQEIIVPVELGAGTEIRRFKLTVTLRLDPVED